MTTASIAQDLPTVAFYGDSITTGHRSISSPEKRWSSLVCAELGWREINIAIDGMGFYRRRGPVMPRGNSPTPPTTPPCSMP